MATIDELRKLLEELDERQLGELGLQKASNSMKDLTNATDEQIKSLIRLNNAEIELALMRGDRLEAENALAELNEKINALQERRIQITTGMSEEERKLAVAQEKEIEGLIKLKDNYKAMGLEARNLTKDQENLKKESDAFFDSLTKGTGIALNASEGIAGSLFKFASAFRSSGDNMNVFLKSMSTYVNMTTIANGLTTKIVESTIAMGRAFDEATAAFAGATGAGDKFNDTLLGVRMEANTAGVNFENASQALQGLMESFVGISSISETAQKELVKTTAQLIRIGVSAQETTSLQLLIYHPLV
jgi:hypothetical protein